MATDVQPDAKAAPRDAGRRPYRFSADQFWKMAEAGVFPESRVELARGRIYLMVKYEPHNFTVGRVAEVLRGLMPAGFYVREEKSMRHDRWTVLEPDVAVTPGSSRDYRPDPPLTSEAVLIVEVCASTPWSDYRQKANLYAAAGTPTYWIVDVQGRKIDVFTRPNGRGREARYAEHQTFAEGSPAPVVLDGREVGRIDAKDLLPPIEETPKPSNPTA
jgi:Uma2 family endonuclease